MCGLRRCQTKCTDERRLHHSAFIIKVTSDAFPAGIENKAVPTESRTPEPGESVVPSVSDSAADPACDDMEKTLLPEEGDSECTIAATISSHGSPESTNAESGPVDVTMVEAFESSTRSQHTGKTQPLDAPHTEEDRFKLVDNFAKGGLGKIWLAHDGRIRREVAFKELLPRALKSRNAVLRNEAGSRRNV